MQCLREIWAVIEVKAKIVLERPGYDNSGKKHASDSEAEAFYLYFPKNQAEEAHQSYDDHCTCQIAEVHRSSL